MTFLRLMVGINLERVKKVMRKYMMWSDRVVVVRVKAVGNERSRELGKHAERRIRTTGSGPCMMNDLMMKALMMYALDVRPEMKAFLHTAPCVSLLAFERIADIRLLLCRGYRSDRAIHVHLLATPGGMRCAHPRTLLLY